MSSEDSQDSIDRIYAQRQPSRMPWVIAVAALAALVAAVVLLPGQWRSLSGGRAMSRTQEQVDKLLAAADSETARYCPCASPDAAVRSKTHSTAAWSPRPPSRF